MRIFLTVLLALCTFCCPGSVLEKAAPLLAETQSVEADFTQTRILALLDHQLVISGRFRLEKGKRMLWDVDSPVRYACLITPEALTQWDADSGKILKLSVRQLPHLELIFRTLSSYMGGDVEAMKRDFDSVETGPLAVKLSPKGGALAGYIRSIAFEFAPDLRSVRKIDIIERNDDVMTIEFSNLKLNEPIPEEKWSIPPR